VAAILALLALARRKTIGRWWTQWREKRRHLRAQIKAERQRELLVASMRRLWMDGYLGSALDLDAIRYLPVRLEVEADGRPARRHPDQVDNLIGVWDRSGRRKLRLTGDWGTGKTAHLLLLARCLLDRSQHVLDRAKETQQQLTEPVPVVLNVSNWDAKEARSISGCSMR
jgi:hypothetical protein